MKKQLVKKKSKPKTQSSQRDKTYEKRVVIKETFLESINRIIRVKPPKDR